MNDVKTCSGSSNRRPLGWEYEEPERKRQLIISVPHCVLAEGSSRLDFGEVSKRREQFTNSHDVTSKKIEF
jgi:hypothetical protein